MAIESINPATGKLIKKYTEMGAQEVKEIIESSQKAFLSWKRKSFDERGPYLKKAGEVLRSRKKEYGELFADEMGKPFLQGESEVEKCALVCDYYAEKTAEILGHEEIKTEARKSYVTFQPLGIVLAVMPWNFPFWQVFRFAAPALMAGNAGLLKHASNVPGSALAIEEVFKEALL